MDAGKLTERVQVLSFKQDGDAWRWQTDAEIWAEAELQEKPSVFSKVGLSANGVKFILRRRELTLHNALRWNGKHCFLTYLEEINRRYLEVRAALVEPKNCVLEEAEILYDEYNTPIPGEKKTVSFPACLTEKYLGYAQLEPMAQLESRFVLVTPKEISLKPGQLVRVEGVPYGVQIPHELDGFKNEYEIGRKDDVNAGD